MPTSMNQHGPLARALSGEFDTLIREESASPFLSQQALARNIFLYLPRLATDAAESEIRSEIRRVAALVRERTSPYRTLAEGPRDRCHSPRELVFDNLSESEAKVLLERFHYLASFRADSRHFALRTPRPQSKIAAIATLSKYDITHITLPQSLIDSEALVLSRVFAFDWAPRNSVSYLISQVVAWCRNNLPGVRVTLTYLNPNVGFDGASYRAANFFLYGYEEGTRYVYMDGIYVTDREIAARFGTIDLDLVRKRADSTVTVAEDLRPLKLYLLPLYRRGGALFNDRTPRTFRRPLP